MPLLGLFSSPQGVLRGVEEPGTGSVVLAIDGVLSAFHFPEPQRVSE